MHIFVLYIKLSKNIMADKPKKPAVKGGGGEIFGELKWFFGIILGIFIVWFFTGGYDRYVKNKKPFIKPPTPLDTGELYGVTKKPTIDTTFKIPSKWEATNTRYLTFYLPPGFSFRETSLGLPYKAEISDGNMMLYIEYGYSVDAISKIGNSNYNNVYEKIDGRSAKISWPKNKNVDITGIFFDKLIGKKLKVYGEDLSKSEQSIAFSIFRTFGIK